MKPRPRTFPILLLLLALALPALPLAPAASARSASSLPATLDDLFSRFEAYGFSGAVLVARHGEILLRKGYGLADRNTGARVSPETVFDVGSITKQFTAAAILRLEMEGKLSTGDPLSRFLPRIARSVGGELPAAGIRPGFPPDLAAITLHQMLSHTAGIDDFYPDQFPSWREYFEEFLKRPLLSPPGTAYSYSNPGYDLLGKVVEAASGEPYERYVRDHLLLPAGLTETGFDLPRWRRDRIARYQDWTARAFKVPIEMPLDRPANLRLFGSGGMLSTVDDLYRWHRALAGDPILSAAAKEKLYRPVLAGYAYGWNVAATRRGTRVLFHGGFDTALGTAAAFYRFADADDDTVFILLANSTVNRQLTTETVAQWVGNLIFGGTVPWPPPADSTLPPAPGIAGRYTLPSGGEIEVAWRNGRPVLTTEDAEAILRLTFPDVLEPAGPAGEDAQMTRIFRGLDAGDWEPLRAALSPEVSFAAWQPQARAWWETQRKALGAFVAVRPVALIGEEFHDIPELQVFLRLDFERGRQVMRALRGAGGGYEFRPEKIPERLELTLAPQTPGTYAIWSFRYRAGPRIVFVPRGTSLKIVGSRSSVTAIRQPTDAARTGA